MAITPGVNLSANLASILGGDAAAGYLRITLCGFGPVIPCVPGTAVIADAGVPMMIGPQVGTTAIEQDLWGNDVITPASTFYEIAVLDPKKNVIQAGLYQFANSEGAIDLSERSQLLGPYGFTIESLAYKPCAGAIPGAAFVGPGPVVAVSYNGILLVEGQALPTLSYTVGIDTKTITLNFQTQSGDRVDAFCIL